MSFDNLCKLLSEKYPDHFAYRLPVTQVVVLLLPPAIGTLIETVFELETTRHEYQVVKMWEQDAKFFLRDVYSK